MIALNEHLFNNRPHKRLHSKRNLYPKEIKAMRQLATNTDIVIHPADNGSAVVLWAREDYLKEGFKQLGNTQRNSSHRTNL
jgi:hypothetical protein